MKRQYLVASEAAEILRCSPRAVNDHARAGRLPHRKLPGTRRLLFVEEELLEYINGAQVETIELEDGGRIVRPKLNGDAP